MTDEERRARGEKMFNEVYGGIVSVPPEAKDAPFIDIMMRHIFGDVWARDVMSVRDRRLLLIGAIAALGEGMVLEIQLRAALRKKELTEEQVNEILVMLASYIGYPRATNLQAAILRAIAAEKAS
jgi:4-carboxymuconolactone decarboxylase